MFCPHMDIEQVLAVLEQILPPGRFGPIEQFVLRKSWLGQTYGEMAKGSGYGSDYIKEIGSQLWQDLSAITGQHITKKSLHLLLNQLQPAQSLQPVSQPRPEFQHHVTAGYQFAAAATKTEIDFPGVPLPFGSPLYVARPPIEEITCAELGKPGCFVRIRASSKMGKTSLLNQIMAYAKMQQYKTVYLDFQEADATIFASLDKFLRWFCANISRKLNLSPRVEDYWDEDMGSKISCKIYFEEYLLKQVNSPLVVVLNEVKRVFEHLVIAQDFLSMLRSWHEQAKQDSTWQKFRLVLGHSTEIYVTLKLNQSPFNVGLAITLPPFTFEQAQDLAQRYGLNWAASEAAAQRLTPLLKLVGGHPYLISLAFYYLSRSDMTLDELLQSAPTQAGIYNHHLQNYLTLLHQAEPQLVSALKQVVASSESVQLDAISAHKLKSMGLIQLDGNHAKPSCELYRLYFQEQLKAENWLDTDSEQLQQGQQTQHHLNNLGESFHLANQSYFNRYLLSNLDESTHLANQSYFNRYLEATWEQLSLEVTSMSLILCKIDHCEVFKDAHGLSNRDICLQLIGSTILDCLNKQVACVARYDDKEFAVILPRTNAEITVAIANNIRESVRSLAIEPNNSKVDGLPVQTVTVSLGVASTTPSSGSSAGTLLAAAEAALHQAKKQGCDCVCLSSASSLEI